MLLLWLKVLFTNIIRPKSHAKWYVISEKHHLMCFSSSKRCLFFRIIRIRGWIPVIETGKPLANIKVIHSLAKMKVSHLVDNLWLI